MNNERKLKYRSRGVAALLSLIFIIGMMACTAVTASAGILDFWFPFTGSEETSQGPVGSLSGSNPSYHSGYVVDISKHNGDIDFNQMKASGVDGCMMRAAYGMAEDIRFEENSSKAEAAGVPYGVYHFVNWHYDSKTNGDFNTAVQKAQEQANFLISLLQGKRVRGYVACDLELEANCTTSLSKEQMTSIANYYMDIIHSAGYKPMLYCSISWLKNRMNSDDVKYPLWIAYYHDTGSFEFPDTNYGDSMRGMSDRIYLWQYSSGGYGPDYGAQAERIEMNRLYRSFT